MGKRKQNRKARLFVNRWQRRIGSKWEAAYSLHVFGSGQGKHAAKVNKTWSVRRHRILNSRQSAGQ